MQFHTLPQFNEAKFTQDNFSQLKAREWKVLLLLIDDFTNNDIMTALNLQRRTVINIRNSIGDKLDLKGAHTLALFCRRNRDLILCRYHLHRSAK